MVEATKATAKREREDQEGRKAASPTVNCIGMALNPWIAPYRQNL